MSDALQRLAELAPTLTAAELRVLIHLAAGHPTASSRAIATAAKLSRSNVKIAMHSLEERGLISSDGGSATRASSHRMLFLEPEVLPGRGPITGPPLGSKQAQGGLNLGPPVDLLQAQGGLTAGPPPNGESAAYADRSKERAHAPGSIDSDGNEVALIDRLLKASPKKYDAEQITAARRFMHTYVTKFGRELNPHPPDDTITAQFLAIAPWPKLQQMLYDLMAERKEPGHAYAWFVTVALQRIHGIAPTLQRRIRADLRAVAPPKQQQPTQRELVMDLQQQITELASRKAMR